MPRKGFARDSGLASGSRPAEEKEKLETVNAALRPLDITIPDDHQHGDQTEVFSELLKNVAIYGQTFFEEPEVYGILKALLQGLTLLAVEGKGYLLQEESAALLVTALRRLLFYGTDLAPAHKVSLDKNAIVEVRVLSVQLIAAAARSKHKAFISQWAHLLPDHGVKQRRPFTPTLLTVLLFDPATRVRTAAGYAVGVLLEDSRPYLQQADDRKAVGASFTAYSVRLGAMLREIHSGLFWALEQEVVPSVLAMSLKTLCTLVINCPYYKLNLTKDLLEFFSSDVFHSLIFHKDRHVRANGIGVLSASFSTQKKVPGINEFLVSAKGEELLRDFAKSFVDPNQTTRVEALRVYASLALSYRAYISKQWNTLLPHLIRNAGDKDPYVRQAVLQLIQNYTQQASTSSNGFDMVMDDIPKDKLVAEPEDAVLVNVAQWRDINKHILTLSCLDHLANTRAATFACYANISMDVLSELRPEEIQPIMNSLVEHAIDDIPLVRSAVCRVLGSWIYHDSIVTNPEYVSDIVNSVAQLLQIESTMHSRVRASWVLANLCDALRVSGCKGLVDVDGLLATLLWTGLLARNDNHKVKCNAVRALGNIGSSATSNCLLQLFDPQQTPKRLRQPTKLLSKPPALISPSPHVESVKPSGSHSISVGNTIPMGSGIFAGFGPTAQAFGEGSHSSWGETSSYTFLHALISELVSASVDGNVKVRWNACYGLGNTLSNPWIVTIINHVAPLTTTAIQALGIALQRDENFKVRIQAAVALAVPRTPQEYATTLPTVWTSVLSGLQNVHLVDDFEQYKYSAMLKEQMWSLLRHLIRVCTPIHLETRIHSVLRYYADYILATLDSIEKAAAQVGSVIDDFTQMQLDQGCEAPSFQRDSNSRSGTPPAGVSAPRTHNSSGSGTCAYNSSGSGTRIHNSSGSGAPTPAQGSGSRTISPAPRTSTPCPEDLKEEFADIRTFIGTMEKTKSPLDNIPTTWPL